MLIFFFLIPTSLKILGFLHLSFYLPVHQYKLLPWDGVAMTMKQMVPTEEKLFLTNTESMCIQ